MIAVRPYSVQLQANFHDDIEKSIKDEENVRAILLERREERNKEIAQMKGKLGTAIIY